MPRAGRRCPTSRIQARIPSSTHDSPSTRAGSMTVLRILSSRERVQATRSRLDGFPADIRRPGPANLRSTNSPSVGRRSSRGIRPRCSRQDGSTRSRRGESNVAAVICPLAQAARRPTERPTRATWARQAASRAEDLATSRISVARGGLRPSRNWPVAIVSRRSGVPA